jgi:hypothetical protein
MTKSGAAEARESKRETAGAHQTAKGGGDYACGMVPKGESSWHWGRETRRASRDKEDRQNER